MEVNRSETARAGWQAISSVGGEGEDRIPTGYLQQEHHRAEDWRPGAWRLWPVTLPHNIFSLGNGAPSTPLCSAAGHETARMTGGWLQATGSETSQAGGGWGRDGRSRSTLDGSRGRSRAGRSLLQGLCPLQLSASSAGTRATAVALV